MHAVDREFCRNGGTGCDSCRASHGTAPQAQAESVNPPEGCVAVFPGISLVDSAVQARRISLSANPDRLALRIHHCRSGRVERTFQGAVYYLEPGDLAICRDTGEASSLSYPTGSYRGITVDIDVRRAPQCLECLLQDVSVRPQMLMDRFCPGNEPFIMRARPEMEHIFSELYHVPESIRAGYYKVKVLELLLFLTALTPEQDEAAGRRCTAQQASLARQASRFIAAHMDERITIAEIAGHFRVSPTRLKESFRAAYGQSVYAAARSQKMHAAARLLRESDQRVAEIAGQFGYDNASKFARAFREVIGVAPNEYRAGIGMPD